MNIKKNIPNTITCGNLFCGCLAVVCAFNGNLLWSAYLVGIAGILDFLDGFIARLLNVHSEIGKQLDSLADKVTFGLVPGVVMFIFLSNAAAIYAGSSGSNMVAVSYLPLFAFFITIFSAIRLAKFNIDTRQTNSFIGVPTPANALLICSFPLIQFFQPTIGNFSLIPILENVWFLLGLTILMSYLLVAELPLFALKFKNFGWADNKIRYSFLIASILMILLFQFIAIPFIIFLYVILSVINSVFISNNSVNKLNN
ncbi:MAG: CDP-alcohol phosphatidyltransferase family protein [Bacteroidetes bacterium]|nr:CDP-alcohol phosphatidyltransferase family protein [Bacteroidota bacterium]